MRHSDDLVQLLAAEDQDFSDPRKAIRAGQHPFECYVAYICSYFQHFIITIRFTTLTHMHIHVHTHMQCHTEVSVLFLLTWKITSKATQSIHYICLKEQLETDAHWFTTFNVLINVLM